MINADPLAFLIAYTDVANHNGFMPIWLLSDSANCKIKICESLDEAYIEMNNPNIDLKKLSCVKQMIAPKDAKDQTRCYIEILNILLEIINGLDEEVLASSLVKCMNYMAIICAKNKGMKGSDLKSRAVIAASDDMGLFIQASIQIVNHKDISHESDEICKLIDTYVNLLSTCYSVHTDGLRPEK
jgi:hypothetical protein